jgi:cyclohexa-1,5-dienecarbonyl-CoA hydratase
MTVAVGPFVRCEVLEEGRVWRLVLDRPKGNVIDRAVVGELREWTARAAQEGALHALVLDHAGEHFSYGASVEEHVRGRVEDFLPAFHALARELLCADVPLLACLRGSALGGGLELALLADRRLAAPGARLAQPEIALGVFAPIGSALLPRLVGPQRAAELLLSGRTLEAEEALRIGLVDELTADPAAAALDWVRKHLLGKSAAALRLAARAARRAWLEPFLADLAELERLYLGELMATRDANEGLAAFIEKRRPAWEDA